MSTARKHPEKALTAAKVRSLTEPGRYADGGGLYLVVSDTGSKKWVLRTVIQGKRTDLGLGGYSTTSLAEAREKALTQRKIARSGGDPLAEKRAAILNKAPTFREAAELVHKEHLPSWKNAKHGGQWINTLNQYAVPFLGAMTVDKIETAHVLRVLSPIWLAKPETARRVRQRLGTVLDWAKAAGYRTGDNPIDGVEKGLPKQPSKDNHHGALPYADLPTFMETLRVSDSGEKVKLAFEFLILTATRTGEVLGARWDEIDLHQKIWTIPAERMKAGKEHRIPLSPRAIEILSIAGTWSKKTGLVFPGQKTGKPLSNMAFTMILRRMEVEVTAHGFRSTFRDWASETTSFPADVCEMALAHTVKNKVEAAYRRGDLFEKRKELMAAWGAFACAPAVTPSTSPT